MEKAKYYVFDNHSDFSQVYADHVAVREDKIFFYDGDAPADCSAANIIKSMPRTWGFFPASMREEHNKDTKTELLLTEMNGLNYLRLVFPEMIYSVVGGYSLMSTDGRVGFIPSWVAWSRHENVRNEEANRQGAHINTNRNTK